MFDVLQTLVVPSPIEFPIRVQITQAFFLVSRCIAWLVETFKVSKENCGKSQKLAFEFNDLLISHKWLVFGAVKVDQEY